MDEKELGSDSNCPQSLALRPSTPFGHILKSTGEFNEFELVDHHEHDT